jgi:hypothetical protein
MVDPELFFDEHDEPAAVAKCHRCPIEALCLEATGRLERQVGYQRGVWGGKTEDERRAMWKINPYDVKRMKAAIY